MNRPAIFDFPAHYQSDGLSSFTITLRHRGGDPVDLTGATVRMQLRSQLTNAVEYTFGTSRANSELIIEPDGVIRFPDINSWGIKPGKYWYDLEVTDSRGFVRTYLRGSWNVNNDVTR